MKKMLTGLQPTGVITLGNYIGSVRQMVENQDKYDSYLFVADMHAITVPQDSKELHSRIRSLLALYLACGIDPKKIRYSFNQKMNTMRMFHGSLNVIHIMESYLV